MFCTIHPCTFFCIAIHVSFLVALASSRIEKQHKYQFDTFRIRFILRHI